MERKRTFWDQEPAVAARDDQQDAVCFGALCNLPDDTMSFDQLDRLRLPGSDTFFHRPRDIHYRTTVAEVAEDASGEIMMVGIPDQNWQTVRLAFPDTFDELDANEPVVTFFDVEEAHPATELMWRLNSWKRMASKIYAKTKGDRVLSQDSAVYKIFEDIFTSATKEQTTRTVSLWRNACAADPLMKADQDLFPRLQRVLSTYDVSYLGDDNPQLTRQLADITDKSEGVSKHDVNYVLPVLLAVSGEPMKAHYKDVISQTGDFARTAGHIERHAERRLVSFITSVIKEDPSQFPSIDRMTLPLYDLYLQGNLSEEHLTALGIKNVPANTDIRRILHQLSLNRPYVLHDVVKQLYHKQRGNSGIIEDINTFINQIGNEPPTGMSSFKSIGFSDWAKFCRFADAWKGLHKNNKQDLAQALTEPSDLSNLSAMFQLPPRSLQDIVTMFYQFKLGGRTKNILFSVDSYKHEYGTPNAEKRKNAESAESYQSLINFLKDNPLFTFLLPPQKKEIVQFMQSFITEERKGTTGIDLRANISKEMNYSFGHILALQFQANLLKDYTSYWEKLPLKDRWNNPIVDSFALINIAQTMKDPRAVKGQSSHA